MDTIYKVSGEDGHIIWRLGGVISDFGAGEWTFSRQHDVRVREENSTHLVISILDNARGIDTQDPSYPMSRGLLLALNEQEMTVTILKQIDHPHGEGNYAPRRGNYQILPNGNIFMGWSELAAQSEHSPDGTILMHSWLMADWLGTYRNYKFQSFTGRPTEKPAVHSIAFPTDGGASMTIVHVSWNGDTEVARWNLYKTTPVDDEVRVLVGSADREGFETAIEFGGLASFVVLEGVDANGEVLGESDIVKTITSTNVTDTALSAEAEWEDTATKARRRQFFNNPTVVFCLGLVSGAMTALVFTLVWRRRGTSLPRMNIPRWVVPGYEKLVRVGGVPGQDVSLDRLKQWKTDGGEDSSVDDVEAEPLRPPSRDSLDFVGEGPDK